MSTSEAALGPMPEWDLSDLYPGTDAPELKRDLTWASDEAKRIRAAYQGKSTVNAELALRGMYLFNARHSVFVDVGVTRLGSGIKESPLVDSSTENRVFMGYLYRF